MTETHIIRCISCGAKNKVPQQRIHEAPKCGKCKASLSTTGISDKVPQNATDQTFDDMVLKSPLPVLVDCWAPWCGPCRMVGPVLDELAAEWQGKARIVKVNVDENQGIAARFNARSIPTLLVFDRGQLKDTVVGAMPKHEIAARVTPYFYG